MTKGGARFGAGRPGWRRKIEHCLRLDMRQLHANGLLTPGSRFSWCWTNSYTGESTGSVAVEVLNDRLVLTYRTRDRYEAVHLTVRRTICNFGGNRPWFVCPLCLENRLVLAYSRQTWACRGCQKLAYASESLDAISRGWRAQARWEALLDDNRKRPKGMWRKTHERLLRKLSERVALRELQCEEQLIRLLGLDCGIEDQHSD